MLATALGRRGVTPPVLVSREKTAQASRTPRRLSLGLAVVAMGFLTSPAAGQVDPHTLVGTVVEAGTGAPVPDALVTVVGASADSLVVATSERGRWRIAVPATGSYHLIVEALGFSPLSKVVEADGTTLIPDLLVSRRPLSLDAVVVTATRQEQRLADVPVATEVVSRQQIISSGASDLGSVLTEQAGVELQGGHPTGTGIMLQGLSSERVLILMDGQPFIGRVAGTVDISRIPASMVDRIEVVKGPQSTLHGSEAMGGVVNIVTRAPDQADWTANASATAGAQGRRDLQLGAVGAIKSLSGVLDLGRRDLNLAPGVGSPTGANVVRWDGLAKVRWQSPVEGLSVEASGMVLDEGQRWKSGQLFYFADNLQRAGRLGSVFHRGDHGLDVTLFHSTFEHLSRRGTSETPVDGTGDREVQRLTEAEVLYTFQRNSLGVTAGAELRRDGIDSDRVHGDTRRLDGQELFAEGRWAWDRVTLSPGVRYSTSPEWGGHATPRVALLVRPMEPLGLRFSVGQGYRAPSFKELYLEFLNVGSSFAYLVRGNPELNPETSANVTGSVEWAGSRFYVRLQGFRNAFDNFIETRLQADSSGVQVFTYHNVEEGITEGGEIEGGVTWRAWRAEASYSRVKAEDRATGLPLLGRPEHSARLSAAYAHPSGVRLSLSGSYTGRTAMRRDDEGTAWRDPYFSVDVRTSKTLPGGLVGVFGVDNLFDEINAEWPGFTGRHIYVGVNVELGPGS